MLETSGATRTSAGWRWKARCPQLPGGGEKVRGPMPQPIRKNRWKRMAKHGADEELQSLTRGRLKLLHQHVRKGLGVAGRARHRLPSQIVASTRASTADSLSGSDFTARKPAWVANVKSCWAAVRRHVAFSA